MKPFRLLPILVFALVACGTEPPSYEPTATAEENLATHPKVVLFSAGFHDQSVARQTIYRLTSFQTYIGGTPPNGPWLQLGIVEVNPEDDCERENGNTPTIATIKAAFNPFEFGRDTADELMDNIGPWRGELCPDPEE